MVESYESLSQNLVQWRYNPFVTYLDLSSSPTEEKKNIENEKEQIIVIKKRTKRNFGPPNVETRSQKKKRLQK